MHPEFSIYHDNHTYPYRGGTKDSAPGNTRAPLEIQGIHQNTE